MSFPHLRPNPLRSAVLFCGWMLVFLAFVFPSIQAQSPTRGDRKLFQKAMSLQGKQEFEKAAKLHEKYLSRRPDWEAKWNLAYCYGRLGKVVDQERLLTDLVFTRPDEPEFKLRLAELLRRQGKYDSAKSWYEKYAAQSADSMEGKRLAALCVAALDKGRDSLGYRVNCETALNSPLDDLVPFVLGQNLYFVTNRTGAPSFLSTHRANDGSIGKLAPSKGVSESDDDLLTKGINLKLLKGGVRPTPVPEAAASVGDHVRATQASLTEQFGLDYMSVSPNGRLKVMARNDHGGYGGMDLFVSYYNNGAWTEFENLGPEVNSPANEEFPYLSNDSTIYFSSDRLDGFGGYDIYAAERVSDRWFNLRHEGAKLNTSYDEVAFFMIPGQPTGYFASNRPGGSGGYDIWSFRRHKLLEIQVVDGETFLPKRNVKIEIVDINQKHHRYVTDAEGRAVHVMTAGQDVFGQFFHMDYHDKSQNISLRGVGYDQNMRLTVPMDAIQRHALQGTVVDAATKAPLEGVTVRVIGGADLRSFTNRKGEYTQTLQPGTFYRCIYYMPGYVPAIVEFSTGLETHPPVLRQDIVMRKGGFHYLEGRAMDTERDVPAAGATIHFMDAKTLEEVSTQTVGPDGMFYKVVEADRDYVILSSKAKYLSGRMDVARASDRADTLQRELKMEPLMPDKVIKTVYFPYRSSTIDAEGFKEVEEVIQLLKASPTLGLELTAHTDSRGGADFNRKLSQQRADALAEYISSRGVERSRIVAIGKGEDALFNNCRDGVTCGDELHAQNRRAEIKLVRLD